MDDRFLATPVLGLSMMPATAVSAEESPTAADLSIETISDDRAFLGLEPVWNRLVEEAEMDHPFARHEWMRAWWESFGAGNKLHILVVKLNADPIAIAPLMLSRGQIYGWKIRRLQSMHNDHSPRFDFIVGRCPERVYREIWNHLLNQRRSWDVLEIAQLRVGCRTLEELERLAVAGGFLVGTWPSDQSPYIDLAAGWDEYLAQLSSQHKKKSRQRVRQLGQLGRVELEVISSGARIEEALQDGLRLEAAGWKTESGTAIQCSPEVLKFYTELAGASARAGTLRLIFLNVAGARIAFAYALCYKNKLFVLKAGYDPQYATYSPYNVLCYLVFQDACERGLTEYEFLGANEGWKLRWAKATKSHCWLYVLQDTTPGRLIYWGKFRLTPKLKQGWRALSGDGSPGHRIGAAAKAILLSS
ncbi:MAG TPA: GNAT family N-acetyltransferase [Candidatus Binatia bacterium]|jgi:CelD/BcsL family acetyltransferase involved in cellulose biosynthesis